MGYSPLYRGAWQDEHLEGATFEEKAFFIFTWSNERIRPSGIYRVTDEQMAADTGLPIAKVKTYVSDLVTRRRIVRDGAWIFVRGYLSRQPKQERLLLGVQSDIASCSSAAVLESFSQKYPLYRKWSEDRLEMVGRPMNGFVSPEQSRAEQSRATTTLSAPAAPVVAAVGTENLHDESHELAWPSPEALVALFHTTAPAGLARVKKLTPARRQKIREYLKAFPDRVFWLEAFQEIARSAFLSGRRPPSEGRATTFKADLDWFLQRGRDGVENVVKAWEGKYRDAAASGATMPHLWTCAACGTTHRGTEAQYKAKACLKVG